MQDTAEAPISAPAASMSRHETIVVRPETQLARGSYPWPAWGVAGVGIAGVALAAGYLAWRHWPRRNKQATK